MNSTEKSQASANARSLGLAGENVFRNGSNVSGASDVPGLSWTRLSMSQPRMKTLLRARLTAWRNAVK